MDGVNDMDYVGIGKRIRAQRYKLDLSQEELAEMAGISLVHMSHIETANTKLSLPVLVDLACAPRKRSSNWVKRSKALPMWRRWNIGPRMSCWKRSLWSWTAAPKSSC